MAVVTVNTAAVSADGLQFLEAVTITDQVAASTAVTKAVRVPSWATDLILTLFVDSMAGTGETLDFVLGIPDWGSAALLLAPTDATDVATLGDWNGITQITAAGPSQVVIQVGPNVTADDVGSATASCAYGVNSILPPWITYTYTTADAGDDCDYAFRLVAQWRPAGEGR